jgi:hypothetical protein
MLQADAEEEAESAERTGGNPMDNAGRVGYNELCLL